MADKQEEKIGKIWDFDKYKNRSYNPVKCNDAIKEILGVGTPTWPPQTAQGSSLTRSFSRMTGAGDQSPRLTQWTGPPMMATWWTPTMSLAGHLQDRWWPEIGSGPVTRSSWGRTRRGRSLLCQMDQLFLQIKLCFNLFSFVPWFLKQCSNFEEFIDRSGIWLPLLSSSILF